MSTAKRGTRWLLLAALVAAPPVLARVAPLVASDARMLAVAIGVAFAAMAISLNIAIGAARRFSLGHTVLIGLGAFVTGLVTTGSHQLPFGVGIVAAGSVGAAAGALMGLVAPRLSGVWFAVATLSIAVAVQNSVFLLPSLTNGGAGLEPGRPHFGFLSFDRNADYLALMIVFVGLFVIVDRNVMSSRVGRAIRAAAADRSVAAARGISARRALIIAFVLSGAMAGVAGALFAHLLQFVDRGTVTYESVGIRLLLVVAIGGLGSRAGVISAALAFITVPRLFPWVAGWDLIVSGTVFIMIVVRFPDGIGAGTTTLTARARGRRRRQLEDAVPVVDLEMLDIPATQTPSVLEVRDLTVRRDGLTILDRVSLTVPALTTVGLVGGNGSGKTTLLEAISGTLPIESGAILVAGRDIARMPAHQRAHLGITRTFDRIGLVANMSVIENLCLAQDRAARYGAFAASSATPTVRAREAHVHMRARETAAAIGLADASDTLASALSYGQSRILEVAGALISGAGILLLDEPAAGLSDAARGALTSLLREIRGTRTVILVEHDPSLIANVCDSVYLIEGGRIDAIRDATSGNE